MTSYRITKIICSACEGGNGPTIFGKCLICMGANRVTVEWARHYANNLFNIAVGGYIAGDHDYPHKQALAAKAERIFELLGEKAPWRGRQRKAA